MLARFVCGLAAAVLFIGSALAEVPRQITWRDLIPAASEIVNPLATLTGDQRLDIEAIAWAREAKERGEISAVSEEYESAVEMADRLRRQGLDVEALLSQSQAFKAVVRARSEKVDEGLDGQLIRMPGYVLPLEFKDTGVKELLLVPYVGACIHVPPPPPNQMVFVKLNRPFIMTDLFTPVWITGRMNVERSTKALSFVDGSTGVTTGYTLSGITIEPYKR